MICQCLRILTVCTLFSVANAFNVLQYISMCQDLACRKCTDCSRFSYGVRFGREPAERICFAQLKVEGLSSLIYLYDKQRQGSYSHGTEIIFPFVRFSKFDNVMSYPLISFGVAYKHQKEKADWAFARSRGGFE